MLFLEQACRLATRVLLEGVTVPDLVGNPWFEAEHPLTKKKKLDSTDWLSRVVDSRLKIHELYLSQAQMWAVKCCGFLCFDGKVLEAFFFCFLPCF